MPTFAFSGLSSATSTSLFSAPPHCLASSPACGTPPPPSPPGAAHARLAFEPLLPLEDPRRRAAKGVVLATAQLRGGAEAGFCGSGPGVVPNTGTGPLATAPVVATTAVRVCGDEHGVGERAAMRGASSAPAAVVAVAVSDWAVFVAACASPAREWESAPSSTQLRPCCCVSPPSPWHAGVGGAQTVTTSEGVSTATDTTVACAWLLPPFPFP